MRYRDYYREQVQVVKDGELVVFDQQYYDLWDAMRVAGSSYGVVTSLTIQMFESHEPHVFIFIVDLSDEDQAQIFLDAVEDEGVNINLYNMKLGLAVFEGIQISLSDGSRNKTVAEEECLHWLDNWMRASPREYDDWKVTRFKPFLTWKVNFLLNLNGRQDYGTLYPSSDWVTSSINLAMHDTNRDDVMRW